MGYSLCSRRGTFPCQGKGKEPLAQRPLPLRPPPETWGTPPYTVTAIRFPALMGRQSCRFLESGLLYPPLAALSPLSPIPPLAQRPGASVPAFGNQPPEGTGERQRKEGQGVSYLQPGVRRTCKCGDAVLNGMGIAQPVGDFWIWSEVRDGHPRLG